MTGISLNIRPTGGCREPSLRSAAPVFSGRNNSMSIKIYVRFFPGDIIIVGEKKSNLSAVATPAGGTG